MGTNTGHVMTLANSIIGVSVLAMPFCYKQCGIVLATLMLILSSIMSRLACYYLIKSAILARRRNFEFLAFHTFGPTGKLTVELSIIGFMLGTCVAFFVVVGDLGPAILGPILNIENPSSIRASVLLGIALLVVLPLGLLRNVDSLAAISAATIAFYICLVLKVMGEATTHLLAWDWMDKVYLWRPAGVLQCIPIFSMALSCQTQLFEIFESVPNASLDKMTVIVRSAVNLCTLMYMAMGFFGYIAFCTQPFSGNLMLSFSQTPTSEVIKMGFVLSVAVSFPLVIFPCRASLHSLIYRRGVPPHHELLSTSNHMPEARFKCITLVIVAVSLVTGILIPNIELVLGLVGSTIGVLICVIIPATLFLCLTTKNNNERLLAQVLFVMGVMIMVLGSYANLYATEQAISNKGNDEPIQPKLAPAKLPELPALNVLPQETKVVQTKDETLKDIKNVKELAVALPLLVKDTPAPPPLVVEEKADVRKEPPIPEAPVVIVVSETPVVKEDAKAVQVKDTKEDSPVETAQNQEKKEGAIHGDAIKKEDDEIKEVQKQEILKKKEELIEKLVENEQKQQQLLEEQKQILKDIKMEKKKLIEDIHLEEKDKEELAKKSEDQKLIIQNDVLFDEHKNVPKIVEKMVDAKNIAGAENSILKQSDNMIKDEKLKIMKEDVVKRNMANGVPLPIAIQHAVPNVESIRAAKIVDNLENPNEGNADGKVLRREILGDENMKEQREKRDLEGVDSVDLNVFEVLNNKDVEVALNDENVKSNSESVDNVPVEVSVKQSMDSSIPDNYGLKKSKNSKLSIESQTEKEQSELKENIGDEQCHDNTKTNSLKFTDQLKPIMDKHFESSETVDGVKSINEVVKKEETTESIIKAPVYLSNPNLVLPADKVQLESNPLANNAKPMKRDLKFYDTSHQDDKKDTET